MIEVTHYVNFVDKWLFSFVFAVSSFFRECFYSVFFAIFVLNDQINRSKVTFSDFFNGFEKLMETSLIKFSAKVVSPSKKLLRWIRVFKTEWLIISLKLDSMRMTKFGSVIFLIVESLKIKYEIKVEIYFQMHSFFRLRKRKFTLSLRTIWFENK